MAPREINRGEIERTVVALAQGYAAEGETVTLTTNMGDCLSRENLHVVEFAGQLEGEFGIDTIPHDHLRFLTNRPKLGYLDRQKLLRLVFFFYNCRYSF